MDRQEWRELQRAVARLVRDAVAPLERKLMLVASKAVVELVRDGLGMQGVQVSVLAGEVVDAEHMQPGGLSHRAGAGAEGVFLSIGGARDDGVVICVSNRSKRPTGLGEGDTAVYSDSGTQAKVFVRASGDIEVIAATGKTIKLSASGAPAESFVKGDAQKTALTNLLNALNTYATALGTGTASDPLTKGTAATAGATLATSLSAVSTALTAALSTTIKGE